MKIDWQLLREQKECLLEMADQTTNSTHILAIEGVLSTLDYLQDQAVENGDATEEEVFGPAETQ